MIFPWKGLRIMSKKSGTAVLREYLEEHVGEEISLDVLNEICGEAGLHHWDRVIRNLIQNEGYDIENNKGKWYKLCSLNKMAVCTKRGYISKKLRFEVLERDNYTCQACGRTPGEDHVKLTMDHVIPVEWGGTTDFDNLQALCRECNEGKQAWIDGEDASVMAEVSKQTNAEERLRVYFQHHPNEEIEVDRLAVVAKTREWTRQVRYLRSHYGMEIKPRRKNKTENRRRDTYIYVKKD